MSAAADCGGMMEEAMQRRTFLQTAAAGPLAAKAFAAGEMLTRI